jgi:hypothetical protein
VFCSQHERPHRQADRPTNLVQKIAQWSGTDIIGAVARPDEGNVGSGQAETTEEISSEATVALANLFGAIDASIDKSDEQRS